MRLLTLTTAMRSAQRVSKRHLTVSVETLAERARLAVLDPQRNALREALASDPDKPLRGHRAGASRRCGDAAPPPRIDRAVADEARRRRGAESHRSRG